MSSCGTKAFILLLYHDSAAQIPFLDGDGADEASRLKITSAFRAKPWSIRVVYKKNEMKRTNYLEIKRIEPTLTTEGVVAREARRVGASEICTVAEEKNGNLGLRNILRIATHDLGRRARQ